MPEPEHLESLAFLSAPRVDGGWGWEATRGPRNCILTFIHSPPGLYEIPYFCPFHLQNHEIFIGVD